MIGLIKTTIRVTFLASLYVSIFMYLTDAIEIITDLVDFNLLPRELLLSIACAGSTVQWILTPQLFDLMLTMVIGWPVFKAFSYITHKVISQ